MTLRRLMEPPGDLLWTHILGVLLGQAEGQVFVPTQAVVACERFALEIEADLARDGWFVRLIPAQIDGSSCDS